MSEFPSSPAAASRVSTRNMSRGWPLVAGVALLVALGDGAATLWFATHPPIAPEMAAEIGTLHREHAQLAQRQTQVEKQLEATADQNAAESDAIRRLSDTQAALRTRLTENERRLTVLSAAAGEATPTSGTPAGGQQGVIPETASGQGPTASDATALHALRLARLAMAREALRRGLPLGMLDGAPPALARYTHDAPPTFSMLVMAFESAAAAVEARGPGADMATGRGWLRRQLSRVVTLRHDGRVLLGDPARAVLGDARRRLLAGDIAGAIETLRALPPAAGAAMVPWQRRAQPVVDADTALDALQEAG